jgi:diguanylate cyclase (GGDEF)-like protein
LNTEAPPSTQRRRNRDHELRGAVHAAAHQFMTGSATDGDPSPLEAALASDLGKLRFQGDLEAQFVADSFPSRKRLLIICGVIGWFGVLLSSLNNAKLMPDVVDVVNLAVMALLGLIGASLSLTLFIPQEKQSNTQFEAVTALNTTLITGAIIWSGTIGQTITSVTHSSTMVGVILYATIAARQRFRWALGTALLSLVGYLVCMRGITPLHQLIIEANLRMLAIATALALMANFSFEYRDRKAWLLRKLELERRATLQDTSDRLRELSIRDPLTGLYNRRQFEADLDQAWSQAARSHQPVAMLLMDVDHFKRYNDTHGHPAGDACLQAVSQALQAVAQAEQGTAGRLGGEEFGLLLPGRTRQAALVIGEQLCEAVRQKGLPHSDSDAAPYVSVSIGVAVSRPALGAPRSPLFQQVDDALYEAKHAGRDRACAAPEALASTASVGHAQLDPSAQFALQAMRPANGSEVRTVSELDGLLERGFKWLRFPEHIEAGFQAHRAVGRHKHLAITAVIGLLLLNVYTLMSRGMFPDVQDAIVNQQLVLAGIMLLMVWVYALPMKPWMSESMYAGAVSVIGIASVAMLSQSKTLTVHLHIVVLFVIPFFAGVVGRQPFWYTCVPSIVTMVACAVMMRPNDAMQSIVLADSLFIIGNATLYTLISAYTLEHGDRKAWLLSQIERQQHEALSVATRQLRTLSMLDHLTGIYNRRQFEADYARIWAECKQSGDKVAMLIMDVDFFKLYNDHHGHPAGDRCLKQLAGLIAQTANLHKGIAARLGGEEFGILLPKRDLAQAMRIGQMVCQSIRQARIAHKASSVGPHITTSVGAACLDPRGEPHTRQLLALADDGLYLAKAGGRNQVATVLKVEDRPVLAVAG